MRTTLLLKVYVAAKFETARAISEVMDQLRDLGCTITCDWAQHALDNPDYFKTRPVGSQRQMIAAAEVDGVKRCDALLLYPHPEGASAYAEASIALALGKPVLAISEKGLQPTDRTFLHHPDVIWVKSLTDGIAWLRGYKNLI